MNKYVYKSGSSGSGADSDDDYTAEVVADDTRLSLSLKKKKSSLRPSIENVSKEVRTSLNTKHRKSMTAFRQLSADIRNPVGWLYNSFTHPVYGRRNYHIAEHAALRIQAHFRGHKDRNEFLRMYTDKNALYYMLVYIFFYFLIFLSIGFKKTSQDGFLMSELLRDLIVEEEFISTDSHILKTFHDVATEEEFWQYLSGPLANNLFPEDCYGKDNFMANRSCVGTVYTNTILTGGLRLMTHRVEQGDNCRVPSAMQSKFDQIGCYLSWEYSTPESTFDYLRGLDELLILQ